MKESSTEITLSDTSAFHLIYVEGGKFQMGDDNGKYDDEKPTHEVELSPFYMGRYQVTQQLWQAVMGDNPSQFKNERRPVETISWLDTQEFIKKLNQETGKGFRLPTEAEWEYAARGGKYSQGYTYAGSDKLRQVGWYDENSKNETHGVGQLLANELGLYDMSGNVYEWCEDWFDEEYYKKCSKQGLMKNPVNLVEGADRVVRGGNYLSYAVDCRSAYRSRATPVSRYGSIGLRLVLSFQSVG